jgi:hypothetical protein
LLVVLWPHTSNHTSNNLDAHQLGSSVEKKISGLEMDLLYTHFHK